MAVIINKPKKNDPAIGFSVNLSFLSYHDPHRDGSLRKGRQEKQKVPKYPKYFRTRNIRQGKFEDVYLKASYTYMPKKHLNINIQFDSTFTFS